MNVDDVTKTSFIGNVKMDFSAYDGKDSYSDGSIEDEILTHAKAGDIENFLRNDSRWPVICHLSPNRNFLLEWFPIDKEDSVLEIGCGLGALTGTLLSKGAHVEAVEISSRRAQICALRNRNAENLTIHVGNLNAMTFDKKFDFVFLVGVLEYAAQFTHTKNPYTDFLSKCKSFLKPDGALVIAIENRLGLEYLSGRLEDHTGKLFDGIKDYPASIGVKTFSRLELKNMLHSCGLINQKFFYPYPDYKFPYIVHSEEMLPTAEELAHFPDNFYDTDRVELFPMSQALPTIINAGLYQEMANSFLVIARQTHEEQRNFPLKVFANNCTRKPKYQLRTEIHKAPTASGLIVKKIARNSLAREHLKTMVENCKIFSDIYGSEHVAQMVLTSDDTAEMEFIDGITFEDYLCRILEESGVNEFVEGLIFYFQNILRGTGDNKKFSDDLLTFNAPNRQYEMDMNFRNVIIRENNFVIFDYEFLLPTLPKKFVAWRAFNIFNHNCWNLLHKHGITFENLIATMELSPDMLKEYYNQDKVIWFSIADEYELRYRKRRLPVKGFKFD